MRPIANYIYLFFVANNLKKGTVPGGFPWSHPLFLRCSLLKMTIDTRVFKKEFSNTFFVTKAIFITRVCLSHQAHLYAELTFVLKGIVLMTLGTWVSGEWCKQAYNNFFVTKLRQWLISCFLEHSVRKQKRADWKQRYADWKHRKSNSNQIRAYRIATAAGSRCDFLFTKMQLADMLILLGTFMKLQLLQLTSHYFLALFFRQQT